jgi:hypothetical protein
MELLEYFQRGGRVHMETMLQILRKFCNNSTVFLKTNVVLTSPALQLSIFPMVEATAKKLNSTARFC